MDRHKDLYKDNCTVLSPKVQRLKCERLAIRTKQRNDQYYSTRNISVSPTPHPKMLQQEEAGVPKQEEVVAVPEKAGAALQVAEENKENAVFKVNEAPREQKSNATTPSRIAKVACKTNEQKWTRQELFLQRFIFWKQTKKAHSELKKQKRHMQKKPFVPVGETKIEAAGAVTTIASTFAPKNHQFTAPEGLKNPADPVKPTHKSNGKQRQSLYTVVPTLEKKKKEQTAEHKKLPLTRKVLLANHVKTPSAIPPGTMPKTGTTKIQPHKTPSALNGPTAAADNKQITNVKAPSAKTTTLLNKANAGLSAPTATAAAKPDAQRFIKPRPLILPPLPPSNTAPVVKGRARIVKPICGGGANVGKGGAYGCRGSGAVGSVDSVRGGGAVGKAKALPTKGNAKHTEAITKPKLAVSMKAKKLQSSLKSSTAAVDKKKKPAKFKLNKQALLEVANQINLPIAETPNDVYNNINPFSMFVTSTKRKSLSQNSQSTLEFLTLDTNISDTISPVEPLEKVPKQKSAAKRQLIQNKLNEAEAKQSNEVVDKSRKSKFNFVRYSEVPSEMQDEQPSPPAIEQQEIAVVENEPKTLEHLEQNSVEGEHKEKAVTETEDKPGISSPPRTPTGVENSDRPINYLSPFVSVTRGKVNSKVEKEKRNSIYLQGTTKAEESDAIALQKKEKESQEDLVAMRRTLETVRYFRKQLKDETERLHAICDKWEKYKTENLIQLQEKGGDDMINVTIGQTKLLTSKKFMQFSGLIDRCERGATAPHLLVNDGSEGSKPITAIDLEGFWCMVGLQVDNVEKRFDNLERWRANNWMDPDDIKPIAKQPKQLAKAKKSKISSVSNTAVAKSKPNSALQQMMRKMHADMRKNKAAAAASELEPEVGSTSTSKRKSHSDLTPQRISSPHRVSSPHRRVSIIVKDRKLHSAAPTILTITTPNRRESMRNRKNSPQLQDSPNLLKHVHNFRRSITNLQKSCGERNDLWMSALKGADQQRRKSIMVTSPSGLNTPPTVSKGRKSILKTPGTAKGKPKNVIFNEELRIKKFKFTIDSDQSDEADEEEARRMSATSENDETAADTESRAYSLRTRKVVLRPSGDFEIPK